MKKRTKIGIITLSTIVGLILLGIGGLYIYSANYYHADDDIQDIIDNDDDIFQTDNALIFKADATDAGVIFYPGGKVEYTSYVPLMEEIKGWGITCVLVKMPYNLAVFNMNAADQYINDMTEISSWYMAGHSLGGAFAARYAANHSSKIKGLIMCAAYETKDISQTDLKVLSIYGSEDKILNMDKYNNNKKNLPSNYTEIVIEGGNHANFGNYGDQSGDGIATITRQDQQSLTSNQINYLVHL